MLHPIERIGALHARRADERPYDACVVSACECALTDCRASQVSTAEECDGCDRVGGGWLLDPRFLDRFTSSCGGATWRTRRRVATQRMQAPGAESWKLASGQSAKAPGCDRRDNTAWQVGFLPYDSQLASVSAATAGLSASASECRKLPARRRRTESRQAATAVP